MTIKVDRKGQLSCFCGGKLTVIELQALCVLSCRNCKNRIKFNGNSQHLVFGLAAGGNVIGSNGGDKCLPSK